VDGLIYLGNGTDVAGNVDLSSAKIKGDFDLTGGLVHGNLDLTGAQIDGRFALGGDESVLPQAALANLSVSRIQWGPDPLLVLDRMSGSKTPFAPGIYDRLAKSYTDDGQADLALSIMVAKQSAEFKHTDSLWSKVLLSIGWALTAYGYRPWIGLIWIALMVLVGAAVFKNGAAHLVDPAKRPRSWLVFSLDSVIPVINLDKDHVDVRFKGHHQYMLYFLRFLGAILVVLVLDILKQ